jgi:hypothetical protein
VIRMVERGGVCDGIKEKKKARETCHGSREEHRLHMSAVKQKPVDIRYPDVSSVPSGFASPRRTTRTEGSGYIPF